MGSNTFGNIFRVTTWGESHGKAIGCVIDGCPAGVEINEEEIRQALKRRSPGQNAYTSPRQEKDKGELLSGVFEGKTTGAPLSILIPNEDIKSDSYEDIKNFLRPGHANFTYLEKYGLFDYRGGGRASARETACRVAAGAVAQKILAHYQIGVVAYLQAVGPIQLESVKVEKWAAFKDLIYQNPLFCPDDSATRAIQTFIETVKQEGDSVGGVIECITTPLPVGLGDPLYEKLEANLAKGCLSIPAAKGIEFGAGFKAATMRGSEHNDSFKVNEKGEVYTYPNHAGGLLGGLSNGMPLLFRVAFKPTSSLRIPQQTLNLKKEEAIFQLPDGSRHDPCVAIRAAPVVEAVAALTLVDALLMNRLARL